MENKHKISLSTAVLMNANIMIGAGIFAMPPLMAQKAGFASFLGWPLVALIFLPIVLTVSKMAKLFPEAGSYYNYSKKLINPTAGFISGWSFYLAFTGVGALLAICLRDNIVLDNFNISPFYFNLLFVSAVTLLSLLSIKTVGRIQNTGTMFKLLPLFLVIIVFIKYWNPSFKITMQNLISVPSTVPMVLFGFLGFESCCAISHLIKGPKSNASKAVLIGFFGTAVLYSLFHLGLLHIMGQKNLAAMDAKDFVQFMGLSSKHLMSGISSMIAISLGIAFANSVFSIFTSTSAMLQSMAHKNLFPMSNQIVKENSQDRPWVAILIQGVLVFLIMTLTSKQTLLLSLINLGVLVAFFLTLLSMLIYNLKTKKYLSIITTVAGFSSWISFVYFSWLTIGETLFERLTGLSTLIFAITIGLAMYGYQKINRLIHE